MDWLHQLDVQMFTMANGAGGDGLQPIMLFLTSRYLWLAVGVAYLIWGIVRRNRRMLKVFLFLGITAGASDYLTYNVLKPGFARKRPCYQLSTVDLRASRCGGDYGFPSNHAANGMAVATAAILFAGWRRGGWLIGVALVVGYTRVYLGVHFPFDILFGFVCGAAYAWLVWWLIWRRMDSWVDKRLARLRWFSQS